MICEDHIKMYNRKGTSPRCIMKVDLNKAYGTIRMYFIERLLIGYGLPLRFVKLIMTCISSAMFSIRLNAKLYGSLEVKED